MPARCVQACVGVQQGLSWQGGESLQKTGELSRKQEIGVQVEHCWCWGMAVPQPVWLWLGCDS